MNDQKIYELLAKTPDIRAVQISDALDQELADVSNFLKALVDEGNVVRTAGRAPNGQPAQIYNLSATFMETTEYKDIKSKLDAYVIPTLARSPTPTSTTKVDVPAQVTDTAAPKGSKVKTAIAYIRLMGKVSTDELKAHMGLSKSEYPGSWLQHAIKDGRIVRQGIYWSIGKEQPASSAGAPLPAAASIPGTALPPLAQTPGQPAAAFRCGLWSDNVLELQRDGVTLTTLTRVEGEHLSSFFNRMLATTEPA